ncbi:30S ribosomal protein S6 [Sandarakinorhabdus sp. AAP62]|uniref:30S ribosomal protein S6 n=1 Tax=Sandarakinorhabdus sp. AAP62 TaxID=1248916 RepID=UPI0002F8348E|nr:30S ribosomal protein S6 [Sandarakinorhabdus sp. AAP62]
MPFYEHVFLARQDLTTAQVETLTEGFTKVLAEGKGQVASSEYWGLRTLAYRIAKNRKAHYVMLNIDAPAAAVAEMERQVGLNEDIIRSMTIRVDALSGEPSAMTRRGGDREGGREGGREGREGRGDRDGAPRGEGRGERPRREPRA